MLKQGCTDDDVHKYREHRNVLNHLRCAAKTNYYRDHCQEYKTNTKKLWQLISQTIDKYKQLENIKIMESSYHFLQWMA